MLKRLRVRNLAIVEESEADFGGGLTVVTGETGAGKSVFMGALALALGARADATDVRDGAKEARVEAEFALAPGDESTAAAAAVLEEQGLPPCEDGSLLVRRVISAAGGSRVWVNDASATVQTLKALGGKLVGVHGPNDHLALADESHQRELLDAYGATPTEPYARAWGVLEGLRAERDALSAGDDMDEECDRLRHSVSEIDAAGLAEEDETDLPARHAAAAHAAEFVEDARLATEALGGDEGSAANAFAAVRGAFARMAKYHPTAEEWARTLDALAVETQELSRTVDDAASRADADPGAFAALDDRLSLVMRLKRKYRCATVGELLALRDKRAARLADLEGRDAKIAELDARIAAAEGEVAKTGGALSAARKKAGDKLARHVTKELHGLGFLQAGFSVALEAREADASGLDRVVWFFEPNPGESARPLAAIASSGEIARVMLAVQAVLAEHASLPVMVFDEIDSNVGGETGRAVGLKLRAVARHRQVVAITHLPQTAAHGARHFVVSKTVSGGRTRSAIREVSGEARAAEIARMLGGAGDVVRRHAEELLAEAAR
ncbi:MAG: DNA repair protein RecN [Kiritimatiellae bacterium]|nr:DNA repair protein RecN [Kiritimatiellia bacterium]